MLVHSISPEARKAALARDRDFLYFSTKHWKIYDKQGELVRFEPNPAQQLMWIKAQAQRAKGRPIRLRILKYRQAGISIFWRLYMLHAAVLWPGRTTLSIADKEKLPADWIRKSQLQMEQMGKNVPVAPHVKASNTYEIYLDEQQSSYHIGSAEGKTPGMGECIQAIHCSECASWRGAEAILGDLLPSVPPGVQSAVVQESTGRGVGDWWYQRYHAAKRGEVDPGMPPGSPAYDALFIPWFIQPEYSLPGATWKSLGKLSDREKQLQADCLEFIKGDGKLINTHPITPGQIAWRRYQVREEFHGNEDLFANQYPANEREAFLAGGEQVFTPEQVKNARDTVRAPIWRGNIFPGADPADYDLADNPSGDLLIWEHPDERFHYVLGADCQWGKTKEADWNVLYVDCLESGNLCARLRCRYDFARWGKLLAAVGHLYNTCPIAPERNALASDGLMPLLLGNVAEWSYPNIWVRTDDVALRGHRPQDYGWLTNQHTKGELIIFGQTTALAGSLDWADRRSVDEMEAYIFDPDTRNPTAPEGANDDCVMARLITGYIAHRQRLRTDLWHKPDPPQPVMTEPEERLKALAGELPDDIEGDTDV